MCSECQVGAPIHSLKVAGQDRRFCHRCWTVGGVAKRLLGGLL